MKHVKKAEDLNEVKTSINKINHQLRELDKSILYNSERSVNLLHFIRRERKLKEDLRNLIIKLHQMENKLIDLGVGSTFGLYRVPRLKLNQYSN